jgi:hypothetical protein
VCRERTLLGKLSQQFWYASWHSAHAHCQLTMRFVLPATSPKEVCLRIGGCRRSVFLAVTADWTDLESQW